jgi:hypothetical protein
VNEALDGGSGEPRGLKTESRGARQRGRVLRARVQDGALVPAEPLGLPEGSEVRIKIEPAG